MANMLLPRLVSLNSLNFDFMECAFLGKDKKEAETQKDNQRRIRSCIYYEKLKLLICLTATHLNATMLLAEE